MYIIPCISSCVYMKINYCLRCGHEWPSKLERVLTCAKCRSPYWDVPRQTDAIDDGSYAPAVITNNIPEVTSTQPLSHHDYVRKKLDPSYVPEKRQTIEELNALIQSIPARKSVIPEYKKPPEDQPDSYEEPTYSYE